MMLKNEWAFWDVTRRGVAGSQWWSQGYQDLHWFLTWGIGRQLPQNADDTVESGCRNSEKSVFTKAESRSPQSLL